MKLSSLNVTQLADLLGVVNTEKKDLEEFEKRIKAQLSKKKDKDDVKVYGNAYTITFISTSRTKFDKAQFIAEFSQQTYDSFTHKEPETRVEIKAVVQQEKAKDSNVLTMNVSGFGEISAGKV